tara:strand:+ start:75 stop:371 length:297 start_codon:yes stop_codon:yes gene_type:complete
MDDVSLNQRFLDTCSWASERVAILARMDDFDSANAVASEWEEEVEKLQSGWIETENILEGFILEQDSAWEWEVAGIATDSRNRLYWNTSTIVINETAW